MIQYIPNWRDLSEEQLKGTYALNYHELHADYRKYHLMSDEEFMDNIMDALHFACVVIFLKGYAADAVLCDTGIIHELIHLAVEQHKAVLGQMDTRVTSTPLYKIRDLFNQECCLA